MENQKEMVEFIKWIATNVKGFEKSTPEEIVNAINGMAQSEEGKKSLQELFTKFKASKQKFQFGGLIKFGGGSKFNRETKPTGLRGWNWEPTFQPREDGKKGGFTEYLDGLDTVTIVRGPYTEYMRRSTPSGAITYEVARNGNIDTYYDANSTKRPFFSSALPKDLEDLPIMFRNITKKYK